MDENTKKKILKILSKAKKENPENPEVSTKDLEEKLNIEDHELESYIRDLKWRGDITYDGPETFEGQDIQITPKGEKMFKR
jgi:Mn-dependent DtxR family transcriptional regulator